jgi:hypothetical protein
MRQKAVAPSSLRKVPAIFCWTRDHAQVPFRLSIGKGDREIIQESQHLLGSPQEGIQQVLRGTLLAATSPLGAMPFK